MLPADSMQRQGAAPTEADFSHSDTVPIGPYGVDAAFMLLQRHGWDIHAL